MRQGFPFSAGLRQGQAFAAQPVKAPCGGFDAPGRPLGAPGVRALRARGCAAPLRSAGRRQPAQRKKEGISRRIFSSAASLESPLA